MNFEGFRDLVIPYKKKRDGKKEGSFLMTAGIGEIETQQKEKGERLGFGNRKRNQKPEKQARKSC